MEYDKLTRAYAKALTVEADLSFAVELGKSRSEALERHAMLCILSDPDNAKLAQWRAELETADALVNDPRHIWISEKLWQDRQAHARAKVRLAVIEDQVKRRRAETYWKGNHDEQ
jgi:hypothetical protein